MNLFSQFYKSSNSVENKPYLELNYYIRNFNNLNSVNELADLYFPINQKIPDSIKRNPHFNSNYYFDLKKKLKDDSRYKKLLRKTFYTKDDYLLLKSLIFEHGIFAFKFFSRTFRNRIRKLKAEKRGEFTLIENEYIKYRNVKKGFRKSDYDSLIYDISVFALYDLTNLELYHSTLDWIKKNNKTKKCTCCGKKYNILYFPDWLYYGANGNVSCCFQCTLNENPTENEISKNLNNFISKCGYIPESNFDLIDYNSTIRLDKNNWNDIYKSYLGFGGIKTLKNKYGTWFEALIKHRVLPNNIQKTGRGIKCLALSGNICNSLGEEFIDNWLFLNNFKFEKEPYYPKHKEFNPNGKKRADWKIGEYYVEYFGLKGDLNYDFRTQEKLNLVKELNLKLISIYPDELNNLKDKFKIIIPSP